MASVPTTADDKKAKPSDRNAARTAAGADFDGFKVLSLVSKIYKPVKELWSVTKALDAEVPRAVHISVEVPADVRTRLLHQQERKGNGQHYFPVTGMLLGGPFVRGQRTVDDTIARDPSVAIALTMLPPSLKYLHFAPHYNLPIKPAPGSVIKAIKFGDEFNHEVDLRHVRGLETVVFGDCFNHEVHFPTGVKSTTFGICFNQEVILPEGLTSLELGCDFDHNLELPSSLKELRMYSQYFNKVLSLPDRLEYLSLASPFNSPLTLPPSLRRLWFVPSSEFNQPLVGLPAGLERLSLGCMFNHPLPDLPAGLISLKFEDMADYYEDKLPSQYNSPITLPAGLKYAKFGYSFNQPIELNEALEKVEFGHCFDQELTIPTGLMRLTLPLHYPHNKLIIPTQGGSRTWKRECLDKKAVYCFFTSECAV